MCGIVGYKGRKINVRLLVDTLKLLEYRGYDSSGIAFKNGTNLEVKKNEGKIEKLYEFLNFDGDKQSELMIAHTRWATHGIPNDVNAHPHVSGSLALVHNGIIENYKEIKAKLKGYEFKSETDSEVIVHLINSFYSGDLFDAVVKAVDLLKGAFAFVVIDVKTNSLAAVKMESPIIIGITKEGYLISSDIPSIIKWTREIIPLENGDIFFVSDKDTVIYNFIQKSFVKRNAEFITWDISIAEKSGYKHFMLKEINEQSRVIKDTLAGRIDWENYRITLDEELIKSGILDGDIKNIFYIACGTSYHAGLVGSYYSMELAGINSFAFQASEFRYISKDKLDLKNSLFVFISQSGETADTLFVARELKSMKANIVAICNVVGSSMSREFLSFHTRAGIEIGVAATKTFTAQLVNILLINLYLAQKRGFDVNNIIHNLANVYEVVDKILENYQCVENLSQKYVDYQNFLYLGRHLMYPIALEGALKLKEISYIHAEAYPSGEMKHGPIALIDNKMPTFYLIPYNRLINKNISNVQEIKARKGKIIALVDSKSKEIVKDMVDDIIEISYVDEFLQPLVAVVVLQLFAYYIADWKGLNVDQPRNLAKSVTVE
ncbi:MAG: glutamine--fructose-6-phosphate transaminase (isomerizing) [bacterium]